MSLCVHYSKPLPPVFLCTMIFSIVSSQVIGTYIFLAII
uniref:Uncharacterized protein n=1 Tax=Anguilla anguilla TaxID=7936 RepID=A0A0E9T170_ANGAN